MLTFYILPGHQQNQRTISGLKLCFNFGCVCVGGRASFKNIFHIAIIWNWTIYTDPVLLDYWLPAQYIYTSAMLVFCTWWNRSAKLLFETHILSHRQNKVLTTLTDPAHTGQLSEWYTNQLCSKPTRLMTCSEHFPKRRLCSQAPWVLEDKRPPPEWPVEGNVEFHDYSVRYREGLDLVLKKLNLSVKGGEKVRR